MLVAGRFYAGDQLPGIVSFPATLDDGDTVTRLATLQLHREALQFSAGHFTILSPTERENLHGHTYSLSAAFQVQLHADGMNFDYRYYKNRLLMLSDHVDRRFLLPGKSRYLRIEDAGDLWIAHFQNERIPFLKRDVVILPIGNITIEELSGWFLNQLTLDKEELHRHQIQAITIQVYNGPSHSGASHWAAEAQTDTQPQNKGLLSFPAPAALPR